jgi:MinD superfamily P-loop ATPase
MNKRIQKKHAKQEQQHAAANQPETVGEAFHRLEEDFVHLAQAVLNQGRELSASAIEEMKQSVERGEKSAEEIIDKIPGMGPQLAQMLHSLARSGQRKNQGPEGNGKPS